MGRERVIMLFMAVDRKPLLLVDDQEFVVDDLRKLAVPLGYATILVANTLEQALSKIDIQQLVISDLNLSARGSEGAQLAQVYKQKGGDMSNFAVHSGDLTETPRTLENHIRNAIMALSDDQIVFIPKFNRPALKSFLDRE